MRKLGYTGCFSRVAALLSLALFGAGVINGSTSCCRDDYRAWTADFTQVAAALLGKVGYELTFKQREIVDRFNEHCPGYAVMRKLILGFRTILWVGKRATLHEWMERALQTGIPSFQRFVRKLKLDIGAVEGAVTERWSNGPVEGHINRLKTIKRQMYGRAGVELLRARLLPEPGLFEHQL